jgi:acyl-CoA reductase-like NAD-dependent aldehyde dehydrogenase
MVFVNVVLADGAELPFGGVKRSGSAASSPAWAPTSS